MWIRYVLNSGWVFDMPRFLTPEEETLFAEALEQAEVDGKADFQKHVQECRDTDTSTEFGVDGWIHIWRERAEKEFQVYLQLSGEPANVDSADAVRALCNKYIGGNLDKARVTAARLDKARREKPPGTLRELARQALDAKHQIEYPYLYE